MATATLSQCLKKQNKMPHQVNNVTSIALFFYVLYIVFMCCTRIGNVPKAAGLADTDRFFLGLGELKCRLNLKLITSNITLCFFSGK